MSASDEEKIQRKDEEFLVENVSPCLHSQLEIIKDNFHTLKDTILERTLSDSFYNQQVMEVGECTLSSLFYISPYDFGSMSMNDRIITYIRNLRRIGGNSAQGYALLADFGKTRDLFVIKSPVDVESDELLHELVV